MSIRFDGQNYAKLNASKYPHDWTLGLGNYRGKALTTGCFLDQKSYGKQTEILNLETLTWTSTQEYPKRYMLHMISENHFLIAKTSIILSNKKLFFKNFTLFDNPYFVCGVHYWWLLVC